jgi:transcription elongation factor Elf1
MLTKEQIEKYLKNPYHCPFCGSEDITALPLSGEDNVLGVVVCNDCGKNWEDEYKVVGVSEL